MATLFLIYGATSLVTSSSKI